MKRRQEPFRRLLLPIVPSDDPRTILIAARIPKDTGSIPFVPCNMVRRLSDIRTVVERIIHRRQQLGGYRLFYRVTLKLTKSDLAWIQFFLANRASLAMRVAGRCLLDGLTDAVSEDLRQEAGGSCRFERGRPEEELTSLRE